MWLATNCAWSYRRITWSTRSRRSVSRRNEDEEQVNIASVSLRSRTTPVQTVEELQDLQWQIYRRYESRVEKIYMNLKALDVLAHSW